jgi:hypothetical protein
MKQNRVISTAVLFLLLGAAIPALAQKGEEEKGGDRGKAQPAQHQAQPQRAQQAQHQQAQPQRAQPAQHQAQPQRAQQAQPQRTQQAQRQAQPQRNQQAQRQQQPQRTQQAQQSGRQQGQTYANNRGNNGNHYGRISDASYRDHFGHGHSFHMMRPQMIEGYNRFQYGGYWFGFNQGWPAGWSYDDTVYVEYVDGAYYLCDLRFPGVQITLNMF